MKIYSSGILVLCVVIFSTAVFADGIPCPVGQIGLHAICARPTPEQGLELLLEGNRNFQKGKISHLDRFSDPDIRREVALGQHPYAIILTCSDSRVPPEILFDKGLGEIFVVRVAGNIVAPHELGSIEYAIEHLGANLIMVLGHEKCGAVKSAYGAYPAGVEGNIGSLIEAITPAVAHVVGSNPKPIDSVEQATQVEACVVKNIELVGELLETKSSIIKEYVETGKVKIIKAKYDLDEGKVSVLGGD